MDKFRIDGHKLFYHMDRVNNWLKGKDIYPIYAEVSTSGACNHRCSYCGLDFMGYQPRFLDSNLLKKRLKEMGRLGVKSIMYAGEGEPLLHKNMIDIVDYTKNSGIDVALTTNGVLLNRDFVDKALVNISWIKVSINGATKKTYAGIHRTDPGDLDKVMKNMAYAVKVRREKKYPCALGMQLLLLPENRNEVVLLAKKAKSLGIDYLVVKPYSQHPLSKTKIYKNIRYAEYFNLEDKLKRFNDDKFNVIFRINTMKKWDDVNKSYRHCMALPFWVYIDAGGNVWGCSVYLTDKRFNVGNINKRTFGEIWNSQKRIRLSRWVREKLDTKKCRVNCRMDEVNRYLWGLNHPPEHINFLYA